jgi:ATP-binding cassette subfamily C (CFTR/MRP) protein 1
MNSIVEATVALSRVSSFLVCQEYEPITTGDLSDVGIRISNASFVYESKKPKASKKGKGSLEQKILDAEWEITLLRSQLEDAETQLSKINLPANEESLFDKQSSSFQNLLCLRRVNLECERGAMIAVVGTVGSGKTSLINAILGEVRAIAGTVFVKGRVAYFAQTPFIMNNTLKENILFRSGDEPYDENAYKEAISVCALEQDLSILPGGDACEIGEKGITLSGGQKARIAMARVVYHDADICLLDDPLAAVDAHVGKHLFQKCIIDKILMGGGGRIDAESNYRGKKKKVVVLVTNALQYLRSPMVDRILVVGDGTVQESGTYSELSMNPASLFSKSLKSFYESSDELKLRSKEHEDLMPNASSSSSLNAMGIIGADADVAKIVAPFDDNKQRRSSARLPAPTEALDSNSGVLTTDELQERDIGHVTLSVYLSWARAAGGSAILFLIVFSYSAVEAINVLSRWWLTHWSFYGSKNGNQLYYLFVYAAINLSAVVATFLRLLFITMSGLRAAKMVSWPFLHC